MNKKVIILFLSLFFIISAVYAEDNDNIDNNSLSELSTNMDENNEDILVENNEINENNNIQNEETNLKNNTETNKESNEQIIDNEDNIESLTPQQSASNVVPKVTVHNITEIRENKLNITMTSNVDGKIYYTRNGSKPTSKSLLYTDGEVLTICVKTQINAIVITNNNIISNITHYQSEQIITPPISVVKCLTDLVNDKQIINFTTNWNNTTTYYTLDGSNPKKSNTRVTYNNKSVTVNKNQTLKFYTKDNLEGYESIVYSYNTPKYYNERATLKVINTTRMYSDNHQKIMIQSNQPTVIEYYSYWGKNKVVHKKFTNEIETTKNTQLIIKSKHRVTGKMGPLLEYMPTKGTRTIMNFTYDLSMPYQDGYILLNTTYLNLNSSYNTFKNNTNILYNNRKEDFEYIKNKSITESGILFYTENNAQILHMKIYGYAYGNISQVSVISSNKILYLDTSAGILTNFSTIINGKLNTTIQMFLKDMNTNLFGNTIPINTSFSSNFINYTIDKKDHLCNWAITIDPDESGVEDNNIIPFQILQTYIISNKIVTKQDMQTLVNKNKTFTRYDLRSAYGTFLTAQSILYFNDEICKYYGAYNNVTFKRGDDTQLLVGVNYKGATYTTTYDPTLGIIITNNATKNEIIQFRFMTTVMLPEWERHAVRLSLQNVTSPLDLLFEDMGLNNNNVTFIIDNETGIITIEPTTNQSYYIEVDLKTGIVKVMMKTDEEDELIKGAISLNTEGYCYHGERSDLLISGLSSIMGFVLTDFAKFILDDVLDYDSDFFLHEAEDMSGSALITAGVLTASTGGGVPLGAIMIGVGVILCFSSTGGNILSSDAYNPYYWADAAPSIICGLCPGGEVGNVVKTAVKIKALGMPLTMGKKLRLKMGAEAAIPKSVPEYIKNKFSSYAQKSTLKFYLDTYGYSRGNYTS